MSIKNKTIGKRNVKFEETIAKSNTKLFDIKCLNRNSVKRRKIIIQYDSEVTYEEIVELLDKKLHKII